MAFGQMLALGWLAIVIIERGREAIAELDRRILALKKQP